MNIVIFSVGPIFQTIVHGGSQKILREVAIYLGNAGHKVTILCTSRRDNQKPFNLSANVFVLPTLKFKETYPEPYYTAPYNLANIILDIRRETEKADVLYIHDGELLYHFLYKDIPTIISLRDFVYPDTLAGGLSFQRDWLLLNSEYVAGCVRDAFSSFRSGVDERIRLIPNGVDLNHFRPQTVEKLRTTLGITEETIPIIYPHRPDPRKGIYESLEAISELRIRLGSRGNNLRLLIPIWMDGSVAANSNHIYQTIYEDIKSRAAILGISNIIIYHPWISYDLMPHYYSLARATLCLGRFVEACSNVSIESVACGTPCVASRVASHRYLLPDEFVAKVSPGNSAEIVDALQAIIETPFDVQAARDFIAINYSYEKMLIGYERVLSEGKILEPLSEEYTVDLNENHLLKLPTWCDFHNGRCYNDYHYDYDDNPDLLFLLKEGMLPAKVTDLVSFGVTLKSLEKMLHSGSIVRTFAERKK
jgi:glycosyltransferase involved in cell wall biosynthesis